MRLVSRVSQPPPLLIALAILVKEKRLLVIKNSKGQFELPGLTLAPAEKAVSLIEKMVADLSLDEQPQQILYLTRLPPQKAHRKAAMGVIKLIHLERAMRLDLSNCHYEMLSALMTDNHVTPLTRFVSEHLTQLMLG